MEKVEWRIYYDNDTVFDNLDGTPSQAPGRGIICIVQPDPAPLMQNVNTKILTGHPFYWWHREWGYWMHSDRDGMLDQLTADRKDVICAVKMGRWANFHKYYEILAIAKSDLDFQRKSGVHQSERRVSE